MDILFALLIATLAVAVIGHGIWVAVAWVLRGGKSKSESRLHTPSLFEDRAAAARYATYLESKGHIDADARALFFRAIADETRAAIELPTAGAKPAALQAPVSLREATPAAPPTSLPPPVIARPSAEAPSTTSRREAFERLTVQREVEPPVAPIPAQTSAAAATPSVVHKTEPPPEPRRPFTEMFAAFMAEKNIRWGELIGGLLIVCCSTALVVSLWSRIESIPILKFVIFTAITSALAGAGLFIHHRWKLPTTGHAILVIATMLVPLNLLAFAAFPRDQETGRNIVLGIEIGTIALFAWLTWLAGRVVLPKMPLLLAGGVIGLSVLSPVFAMWSPAVGMPLLWAGAIPVALYATVVALSWRRQITGVAAEDDDARRILLQLGVQTFAGLAPLGLLGYQAQAPDAALRQLSPILCALAGPGLVVGLLLWRRFPSKLSAGHRTTAAAVSIVASAIMLLGVVLAWPTPARLVPALLINAIALAWLAWKTRQPAIHGAAAGVLAIINKLVVLVAMGHVAWNETSATKTAGAILSAASGHSFIVPVLLMILTAASLRRRGRLALSNGYGVTALTFFILSAALITVFGFGRAGDPHHAAGGYLALCVIALIAAFTLNSVTAAWCACLTFLPAAVQILVFNRTLASQPWATALLAYSSILVSAHFAMARLLAEERFQRVFNRPLSLCAGVASFVALALLATTLSFDELLPAVIRAGWLGILWLALAYSTSLPPLFFAGQLTIVAAAVLGVHHHVQQQEWYNASLPLWQQPLVWQRHLLVAALLGLLGGAMRMVVASAATKGGMPSEEVTVPAGRRLSQKFHSLLSPSFAPADRVVSGVVLLALTLLVIWNAWPIVPAEHGWSMTGLAAIGSHDLAGIGSWLCLSTLAFSFALRRSEKLTSEAYQGLLLLAACAVIIGGAIFAGTHNAVTAWRSISSALFLITFGLLLWSRGHEAQAETPEPTKIFDASLFNTLRLYAILLFAAPAIGLTVTTALAAAAHAGAMAIPASDWAFRFWLIGPLVPIGLALFIYALRLARPDYAVAMTLLAAAMAVFTEATILQRAATPIKPDDLVWWLQLAALVCAATALLWRTATIALNRDGDEMRMPAWPLVVLRAIFGLAFLFAMGAIWLSPELSIGPISIGMHGTVWAIAAVLAVEAALFFACGVQGKAAFQHHATVRLLYAVVLIACACEPYDLSIPWLCFHVLMIGLAVSAVARFVLAAAQGKRLLGAGWQETFETAAADAARPADVQPTALVHDLSCTKCGYNLRGLDPAGRCPECNTPIAESRESAVRRLDADWIAGLVSARRGAAGAVTMFTFVATLFALRGALNDPQSPWWSSAVLAFLVVPCFAMGIWRGQNRWVHVGAIELCLSASVWWVWRGGFAALSDLPRDLLHLANVNVVALAIAGLAWMALQRRFRRADHAPGSSLHPPHFFSWVTTAAVLSFAVVRIIAVAGAQPLGAIGALDWIAWFAATILAFASASVRPRMRGADACLYTLGLSAMGLLTMQLGVSPAMLSFTLAIELAAYALVSTLVFRAIRRRSAATHDPIASPYWLAPASGVITLLSVALAFHVVLNNDSSMYRALGALAPLLGAAAAIAQPAPRHRPVLYSLAVHLIAAGVTLLAWSWLAPAIEGALLLRAIAYVAAASAMTIAAGAAVRVLSPHRVDAIRAVRDATFTVNLLSVVALGYCAAMDILALIHRAKDILPLPIVITLIAAIAVNVLACVLFALADGWDPLRLPAPLKGAYVYAGEVFAAVLGLHIRACFPEFFHGTITQYWPLLVMGLAFAAIGCGEWFERKKLSVLARPLGRTGMFLPALAMLDLFISASVVHYSIVLLTAGALYAAVGAVRKSPTLFAIAGALFTASLWYFLHHQPGLGIARHPQLWFIPPALAVLAAGHFNRSRLTDAQSRALNYACLIAIYVSSTADVFLVGVKHAPWLPLVLGGFSVAGVLAGIAFRIRSFLQLGTGFLCLALFTIIWHAAEDLGWTWVWYIAGIVLGISIITLFALFEKKRAEMLAVLKNVREWRG